MSYLDWMPTYTGKKIYYKKFKSEDVDIVDIAHHLSLISRFGGATSKMDSVAQHSVIVARLVANETKDTEKTLWGLLHDAGEAYVGDLKVGVKQLAPEINKLEDRILQVIISTYGLTWPQPDVVHKWDRIVGWNEGTQFIKGGLLDIYDMENVPKLYITPWTSEYAEMAYLETFKVLKARLGP